MESFELNKIAGGVLSALLMIFGVPQAVSILGGGEHGASHAGHETAGHDTMGYALPMPKQEAKAGGAPVAEFSPASVIALLPKASADAGKDNFKVCTSCHGSEKGGPNKLGPNLWGIVGRDVGKHEGFNYSPAMAGHGGKWTFEALAAYLHDPKAAVPGNKMAFGGVKEASDLADLLAFLRTQNDSPPPLPAVPAAAPAAAPAAEPAKK
ncbi:MAG: cytochrome c family protein [Proteobacteria bacterium]|nr:cytochrome c family protein [Pseudomonadota bacterium]